MRLICAECEKEMIVEGDLHDGDIVTCPSCGQETAYRKPSRIAVPTCPPRDSGKQEESAEPMRARPKLRVIRKDMPSSGSTQASNIPPQRRPEQGLPPKPPRPHTQKTHGQGGSGFVSWLFILAAAGAVFWGYRTFLAEPEDAGDSETARPQLQDNTESEERARRQKQKAKEEAEQRAQDRQREKERKDREREEARAAMKRKAEEEKANRMAYRAAVDAFAGKDSYFAIGVPQKDLPDPRQVAEERTFWAADKSFCEQGLIYEIRTGAKGIESVFELLSNGSPRAVETGEFVQRMASGIWAVSTGDAVWLWGTGKSARLVPLPGDMNDICPLSDELDDAAASVMALRMRLPDVRYRLSLKPKIGGEDLPLGIIQGRDRLPFARIRDAISKVIVERRLAKSLAQLKKPKAKKFKPTVVFYDGNIMSKSLNGVTRVPRSFEYRGTSRNDNNYAHASAIMERARQKWEKMRAEAERQERKAREVEAENFAALQTYQRKREELSRNVSVSEQEIESELGKYRLLIERSRTKIQK